MGHTAYARHLKRTRWPLHRFHCWRSLRTMFARCTLSILTVPPHHTWSIQFYTFILDSGLVFISSRRTHTFQPPRKFQFPLNRLLRFLTACRLLPIHTPYWDYHTEPHPTTPQHCPFWVGLDCQWRRRTSPLPLPTRTVTFTTKRTGHTPGGHGRCGHLASSLTTSPPHIWWWRSRVTSADWAVCTLPNRRRAPPAGAAASAPTSPTKQQAGRKADIPGSGGTPEHRAAGGGEETSGTARALLEGLKGLPPPAGRRAGSERTTLSVKPGLA